MTEVKILIEGYATSTGGDCYKASPTTTLIKDSGQNIIVDPGANKQKLLSALKKEKLKTSDIDMIFLTHYHPDHFLNIKLFDRAPIYDGTTIYKDDEEFEYSGNIPNSNVAVIPTPGHAYEHASLLVNTNGGRVCVAGDLWWWPDNSKKKYDTKSLLLLKDPFARDKKALLQSRKKILRMADTIIPGHGKQFEYEKI